MTDTPKGAGVLRSIGAVGVAGVGVNYLTQGKVISTIMAVKDSIAGILSGAKIPSLVNTMPIVGKLAPFALPGYAVYKGIKIGREVRVETNSKLKGIGMGLEKGFMTYGVPAALLGVSGLLSLPLSSQVLIAGLTLKGVRHGHKLLMNSISSLKKAPSYLSSLPGKALAGVKKLKPKKRTTPSTPATPPSTQATPPSTPATT
ncbi:hypothetical protein EOM39_03630 [Candidatus Gracilibacteria bacterium]|nr:hypothetical protein [Candidatus Gracilibacteria bacterium]